MKHSLKFSSLIIFATTIASAFTSCGNDSELFEEPVMYQTRAMTRANTGPETSGYWRVLPGNCESDSIDLFGVAKAVFKLSWQNDAYVSSNCVIEIKDEHKGNYIIKENTKTYARIIDQRIVEAQHSIKLIQLNPLDTLKNPFFYYSNDKVVEKVWVTNNTNYRPTNIADSLTIQNQ